MVLAGVAENPIPSGAVAGFITSASARRLRFARWPATVRQTIGTVCLLHGRTEFIEKYFETAADLRRRGFAVATFDWVGQGGSDRLLRSPLDGHCDSFEDYVADLGQFMREVVLPDCPPPYYALAHSMGATILLHALTRRPSHFERAVLSAPMLRLSITRLPHSALKVVSEVLCLTGLGSCPVTLLRRALKPIPFEGNLLTSDPRRFARTAAVLAAAPYLAVGEPTIGWLNAACEAMEEIDDVDFPARLQTPVLMVAAGADRIVSSRAIERLARRLRNGGHVFLPGARHEILMERDLLRNAFWGAFDAFIPGSNPFGEQGSGLDALAAARSY